jgi:hypothetical protein
MAHRCVEERTFGSHVGAFVEQKSREEALD